ncbi:suppressor of fused homolog [Artemia franciscana]
MERPMIPLGLEALYKTCSNLYSSQQNPLQVTAVVKFWLGGPDPLDYVSMYENQGKIEDGIPPHWHYISFGLSDLHGDGRVHRFSGPGFPSGFGFELSFRLKKKPEEKSPPTWPASLMQALARYVFTTDNVLQPGDHVTWHCPLDGSTDGEIRHLLMIMDNQFRVIESPFGSVRMVQIVGITQDELKAAQKWNGLGVANLLRQTNGCGGPLLVTDINRRKSIFQLNQESRLMVEAGVEREGSDLAGVSARLHWMEYTAFVSTSASRSHWRIQEEDSGDNLSDSNSESDESNGGECISADCSPVPKTRMSVEDSHQIRHALQKGLDKEQDTNWSMKSDRSVGNCSTSLDKPLLPSRYLSGVSITMNAEAGGLLPCAVRGRLRHGRHFTFQSANTEISNAVTFVTPSVIGSMVTREKPYAAAGGWLQILVDEELLEVMEAEFRILSIDSIELPKTFVWAERKLAITIVPDEKWLL